MIKATLGTLFTTTLFCSPPPMFAKKSSCNLYLGVYNIVDYTGLLKANFSMAKVTEYLRFEGKHIGSFPRFIWNVLIAGKT